MFVTVASILEIPAVQDAGPVVLGGAQYLASHVRWVHTTDSTELAGLLKGDELILTEGAAFTGSVWEAMAYLDELVRNGASGVMVSALADRAEAKSVLREASQNAKLPVILLKDRVPFVELTEAVHRVLLANDLGGEPTPLALAELFDRLSLESSGPAEALRRTSELLLAPVVYEDLQQRVVLLADAGVPLERLLSGWRKRSRAVPTRQRVNDAAWPQAVYREDGEPVGRLIVPEPLADPQARLVLERAAQLLQRCFENLPAAMPARFRAPAQLFHDLRDQRYSDEQSVALRAEAGGFDRGRAHLPVVFRGARSGGDGSAQSGLCDLALLETVYDTAHEAKVSLIAGRTSAASIGSVLRIPEGTESRTVLQRMVEGLRRSEHDEGRPPATEWSIAVGPATSSLREAVTAGIMEAEAIADAASDTGFVRAEYYTAGDVRLRRLMRSLGGDPRVRRFAEESLADLRREGPEILHVLRRYIELNGNVAELARTLFLSRPSVYARIRRIEEIIGSSLSRIDIRMGLYVALLAESAAETEADSAALG